MSNSQFQFTLQSENLDDLNEWAPKVLKKLRTLPQLQDANTDQQMKGLSAQLVVDRDTATRLGVTAQQVDTVLSDSFGQAQVSVMYRTLNQYHVVLEVAPQFQQNPDVLSR